MPADLSNTVPFPHQQAGPNDVMLAPEEQERLLGEAEAIAASPESVDAFLNMIDGWKANAWNARAQQLETLILEITSSPREPRSDLTGPTLPPGVRDITKFYINTSRDFIRRNYPPLAPGGPIEVHRGLREDEMNELRDELFSRIATTLDVEAITVTLAPVARFTILEGIAEKWGDTTAVVSPTLPSENVAIAVDLVLPENVPEGEVAYLLNEPLHITPERVSLDARRNLEDVLEQVRRGDKVGLSVLLTQAFRLVQGRLGRTTNPSRAAKKGMARLAKTSLEVIEPEPEDAGDRVRRDKAERLLEELDVGGGLDMFRQRIRDRLER